MFKKLDINSWERKDAYFLFKDYDDPFFNVTAMVKITTRVNYCKRTKQSFFLNTLHAALKTINQIDAFKTRILGEDVIIYDIIHGGSTIFNDDKSFSFCYFDFTENLDAFVREGELTVAKIKAKRGLDPKTEDLNMIHFSSLPWIKFTSFKHARNHTTEESIPKIIFGKYYQEEKDWYIPVSVQVHHALMDGFHMGQFYELFEKEMMKTL